jgi:rhodanese-related sulfurtransferase
MSEVTRINSHQLQEKLVAGESCLLVDVRSLGEYGRESVSGSVCFPLDKLCSKELKLQLGDEPKPIYLMCQAGKRAEMAAQKLAGQLANPLVVVEGGIEAWKSAGFDIDRGKGVMSLERQVRIAAGALVFTGVVLGFFVHPAAFGLSGFVGAGLMFAGITDTCAMGMLIAKMPWNRG